MTYLLLVALTVAAPSLDGPLTLDEALAIARAENPKRQAAGAEAEAMAERPSQAGALPDPTVSLKAANLPVDSWSTADEPMTQMQVGLKQTIPFPGKRGLLETAATHQSERARWRQIDVEARVDRAVREGWWNLFFLDRALETVRKNRALMRQLVRMAESRYALGEGLQQDALLAQLEMTRLIDREDELVSFRRSLEGELNGVMGRPATTPITLGRQADERLPRLLDDDRLIELAMKNAPLLFAKTADERGGC